MTKPLLPPKKKNPLVRARVPVPTPAARSRAALGLAVGAAEGRFALQVCATCEAVNYPPRDVCEKCLSDALRWRDVDPDGAIVAMTTMRVSGERWFRERAPWRTALVRLDAGPKVIAHLHGDCAPGTRVRLEIKLDQAGRGAIFALPVEKTPNAEDDPALRSFTADPKFRRVLITDGRAPSAPALAKALVDAGATRVFVGMSEMWKPYPSPGTREAIEAVPLDLTDPVSVTELAGRIGDKVDILVNNASYVRPGGLVMGQDAVRSRLAFETNCLGLMRLAAAFGPVIQARAAELGRNSAAFVNIMSAWCLSGAPEFAAYVATQAAVRSLSHSLRAEMRPSGVKVVDVLAGPMDDEWHQTLRPPKITPGALAKAVVEALRDGREEIVVGEIAKEIHSKWADDPRILSQETL